MPSLGASEESGAAVFLRSSPALETAKIFQLEIVELNKFAQVKGGLVIAVVQRGEFARLAAKVGKRDVGLVPILKGQLPLDAAIMGGCNHGQGVALIVPRELLPHLNMGSGGKSSCVAGE